jgi:hypothetical protein
MDNANGDIHNRHAVPASPAASNPAGKTTNMAQNEQPAKEEKAKSKTTQAQRDAHFQEDGVRADGTVPKQEDAADGEGEGEK